MEKLYLRSLSFGCGSSYAKMNFICQNVIYKPTMQQDGARLAKLKDVFKKAIQEILQQEESITTLITSPAFKDSFYSESTMHVTQDDVKQLFMEIKGRFTEVFKTKLRQTNLDFKLNNLDKDIKDGRISYSDIKNTEYIREIFESNIVDKKEELARILEKENEDSEALINMYKSRIAESENKIKKLEEENALFEKEYQTLIRNIESVFNE